MMAESSAPGLLPASFWSPLPSSLCGRLLHLRNDIQNSDQCGNQQFCKRNDCRRADSAAAQPQSDQYGGDDDSGQWESQQIGQKKMSWECPEISPGQGSCRYLTGYGHSRHIPYFPDASCKWTVIGILSGP